MLIANYEADELLMQTTMASCKRKYTLKLESGATYPLGRKYTRGGRFSSKAVEEALAKLNKHKVTNYTIECDLTYQDMNLASFLMEKQIRKVWKLTGVDRIDFWLGPSDGSNFRFKSAVTAPYKSNRQPKPELLLQLREYLMVKHHAQEIIGYEADDALGIYQKCTTIAVHCDKDIFMIPGKHYNTMKDETVDVVDPGTVFQEKGSLKGYGCAFFYAQLLMGDKTDTIPSLHKGYGPVHICSLFANCEREEDYVQVIKKEYQKHEGDNWIARLKEQADLVWICREEGVTGARYVEKFL